MPPTRQSVASLRLRQPSTANQVALGASTNIDPWLLAFQAHLEVGPLDVDDEILAFDVLGQRQQDRHVRQVLRPGIGRAVGHVLDSAATACALRPSRAWQDFVRVSLPKAATAEYRGV